MVQLSEIWIYPVKSLAGISLQESKVAIRGLEHDRRWMLVDPDGKFVSQREIPGLALLNTKIESDHLVVFEKNRPESGIRIPFHGVSNRTSKGMVEVWSARCRAELYPEEINAWFSDITGAPLRLVHMPEQGKRATDGRYAPKGQYVSFADAFPFLLLSTASLDDLNSRLKLPVPMNRFRPNFVCTGMQPFEEDTLVDFSIGSSHFRAVKPCARCIMTTIDQDRAVLSKEPLKTLTSYRRDGNKVLFGQNLVWLDPPDGQAVIRAGDRITRLD